MWKKTSKRSGKSSFTSVVIIVGWLFNRHTIIISSSDKESKDMLLEITRLRINVSGGDNNFYNGIKIHDLGERNHVLNHSHRRCGFGTFGRIFH